QLLPGADWHNEMVQGAATASVLVAIVSPGWLSSKACQEELHAFRGIAVVSALTLNVQSKLPKILQRYQWEEFFVIDERGIDRTFVPQDTGEFRRAIDSLAAGIVRLLALPSRSVLDRSLRTARLRSTAIIRERCATIKVLDMERPIDSEAIYTRVN